MMYGLRVSGDTIPAPDKKKYKYTDLAVRPDGDGGGYLNTTASGWVGIPSYSL